MTCPDCGQTWPESIGPGHRIGCTCGRTFEILADGRAERRRHPLSPFVPEDLDGAIALVGALTSARAKALFVLTEGPARRSSYATSYSGLVYWQSADWLVEHGLATIANYGREVTITDLGRWVLRRRLDGVSLPSALASPPGPG